jgi:uncharacterized membrane protein
MTILAVGLLLFLGTHSVRIFAPQWRDKRIAAMGELPWKLMYSLVALATFSLVVYGYSIARLEADIIYSPPAEMHYPMQLLMLLSLILIVASQLGVGYIMQTVHHPMVLAVIFLSVAHILTNGDSASVLLFGSFLVWAIIDLKSALHRPMGERQAPNLRNDALAVGIGLAIYILLAWKLHEWLFGV